MKRRKHRSVTVRQRKEPPVFHLYSSSEIGSSEIELPARAIPEAVINTRAKLILRLILNESYEILTQTWQCELQTVKFIIQYILKDFSRTSDRYGKQHRPSRKLVLEYIAKISSPTIIHTPFTENFIRETERMFMTSVVMIGILIDNPIICKDFINEQTTAFALHGALIHGSINVIQSIPGIEKIRLDNALLGCMALCSDPEKIIAMIDLFAGWAIDRVRDRVRR